MKSRYMQFINNKFFGYLPLTYILNLVTLIIVGVVVISISIWMFAAILLITVLLTFIIYKHIKLSSLEVDNYINERVHKISTEQGLIPIPMPYTVVGTNGEILWHNSYFKQLFMNEALIGKTIQSIIPEIDINFEVFNRSVLINSRQYKAICNAASNVFEIDNKTQKAYYIFLEDVTENNALIKQLNYEKTAVALVFVDNYDEVFAEIEDFRHSLLTAHVDRNLNAFAQNLKGIIRKFENDKYLLIFSYENIEQLKDSKFSILDQVREINIGGHLPLTLSMGIGTNAGSLSQSMASSRSAIDLALSRGGDQCVIRDAEKYFFYGGKLKTTDSNTRVRARVKAYGLSALIEDASRVFVMGHKNADFDCFGAAIGIYRIATSLDKQCHIVSNGVPINLSNFYTMLTDLPEYEGKLVISESEACAMMDDLTLLVIVDTFKAELVESRTTLECAKKIVVFDHHRKGTQHIENIVLAYHEPYASSTCELIAEMLQYIKDGVKLKPLEADALLAGITVDTKSFSTKTGSKTFEAAAFLRRSGADTVRVRNMLKCDMETYKARAATVNNAEIFRDNIAISDCPQHITNPALATAQAADELLNISGIEASFVLCRKNDRIVISARSLGNINVHLIMEKLGGGGHQSTAGAQLSDATIYSARDKVKNAILEYLNEV